MPRARDHGMDALRTLAVLAMMASHTARLIAFDARPVWARKVLLFEPIIPSLFLLLVGLSLAQSLGAALRQAQGSPRSRGSIVGAWYLRQLRRAAVLWAISAVFFTAELGFRLPDALTASGILANIAYAIVLLGGLLALPWGRGLAALAWIAGAILFVKLDAGGQSVFLLNSGNSPLLPLWLFTLAGVLWGSAFGSTFRSPIGSESGSAGDGKTAKTAAVVLLGIGGVGVATWLIRHYGAEALFTSPIGRSDAGRTIPAPLFGGESVHLSYYNLRPFLSLACLGLHVAMLVFLTLVFRKMREGAASFVFALGRHALGAYIIHLSLLAAFIVIVGKMAKQPLKAGWQVAVLWASVAVISWIWAIWREKRKSRRYSVLSRP
jgi:hypothetical protein